jgi:sulfatase maturation enzyme AslB (radical SAM superfamily)
VESDPKRRIEQWRQFQQIVCRDIPLVNLVTLRQVTIYNRRVHDHTLTAGGLNGNLSSVFIALMPRIPMHRFLFGPVNSRRLGRSLGVDLLPFKTCSLDCIYCECGWTTDRTIARGELVPTSKVIAELDDYLPANPDVDYVTFSGSGEPTLHTGTGTIIEHLKRRYPKIKVAVLTNGTLLGDPVVQSEVAEADLVVPSLDGATETAFRGICRPADGVTVATVIDGMRRSAGSLPGCCCWKYSSCRG